MILDTIHTDRLILMSYTIRLATNILGDQLADVYDNGLQPGEGWPDEDTLETLPRILTNLQKVGEPTGFESWMVIKKDGRQVIGDVGFKGVPNAHGQIDIGYGIIKAEQKKGYAAEAAAGLIRWAFTNESVKEITARCLIRNTASVRVLEKIGFKEVARDREMIHWSLMKEEW